ncbi:MAG: AtpZ/AtpI family protein [Nitrospinota bacterium]
MSPGRKPELGSAQAQAPGPESGGDSKPGKRAPLRQIGDLLAMGWNFALSIGIGLALGIYLDKWLGTRPWGTIVFLLLGVAAGFVNLFRTALRLEKRNDKGGDASGSEEG